jgi:NAD(P)-dependent dehydrogenase (short-subunit alcohol dehydrogenase family)
MPSSEAGFRRRRKKGSETPLSAQWVKPLALALLLISAVPLAHSDSGADEAGASAARTVLITGANRGIGLELSRQYSAAGWHVIGTARKPESAPELSALGAEVMQLDVTDPGSAERLSRELGARPVDLVINNAGILPMMRTLEEIDMDAYERVMDVNALGPVRVTRAVLSNLRAGQLRKIVNITSTLGSIARNTSGSFYGYRESKAALNMFTKSLAADLGPEGFTCIVLHPGWVRTDMGGPNAPTTVQDSVRGIRRVIDGLTTADNGSFFSFEGERMPW